MPLRTTTAADALTRTAAAADALAGTATTADAVWHHRYR